MKNLILLLFFVLCFLSCDTRGCQSFERKTQFSDKKYHIRQFSGGQMIGEWKFTGIVNTEEGSDGYYFKYNDKWIEISGDIQIEYE